MHRVSNACLAVIGALLASLGAGSVSAEGDAVGLSEAADGDPLDLARAVAARADETILATISAAASPAERLAAVRAAAWLRAPEDALAPLIPLVESRDPDLAPAAARAVARIAASLDMDVLAAREVAPDGLSPVRAKLDALADRDDVRADIRALAAEAAFHLSAAGVR